MSCVRWQVTQVEGLINDALASKCGVPMQKDGHDLQTGKGEPKSDVVLATMSTRHVGEYVMIHFSKNDVVFIFGCAGSLLLCGLFSSCREWGPLSSCDVQASHCDGFSCGAQAGHVGFGK